MDAGAMDSAHGTRTVRLQRKKSGLDFSVKGGKEHGIPIVVSWIKESGAAAKNLHLGDVILAVNGRSLQDVSHAAAVERLRKAGQSVVLRIKPNQALGDIFSMDKKSRKDPSPSSTPPYPSSPQHGRSFSGLLPKGWERKMDHRTGRPYYENHYTETTTWTDPRSLIPTPLHDFNWSTLPPGWEILLNDQGDIFYACHDTQTTHWDSPRGLRQQRQLNQLLSFLNLQKMKLKNEEDELRQKRDFLLQRNCTLDSMATTQNITVDTFQLEPTNLGDKEAPSLLQEEEEEEGKEGISQSDIIDDIMVLNEEVDVLDSHVTAVRRHLKSLSEILTQAQFEDIGDIEENKAAAKLALKLFQAHRQFKNLELKLHDLIVSLDKLREEHSLSDAPLQYMMQLPPHPSGREGEELGAWLHTLPDRLTGKTNCEMRVELCLLQEMVRYAEQLRQRLATMYGRAVTSHFRLWDQLLDEVPTFDLLPLQDQWLLQVSLQEKLEKLISQD